MATRRLLYVVDRDDYSRDAEDSYTPATAITTPLATATDHHSHRPQPHQQQPPPPTPTATTYRYAVVTSSSPPEEVSHASSRVLLVELAPVAAAVALAVVEDFLLPVVRGSLEASVPTATTVEAVKYAMATSKQSARGGFHMPHHAAAC